MMNQAATLRSLALIALAVIVCTATASSGDELVTSVYSRNVTQLNGRWHTIVDPFETGFYDYRYNESQSGFFRNRKPSNPSDLVEYDFDRSDLLNVPGSWNSQDERLFFYEGTVWYKKAFEYRKRLHDRVYVYFGACNYQAVVYLNGHKLGTHIGGFTPFNFEVTDRLNDGENVLIVKVDNKRSLDAIPTINSDWWNYGGITRDVMLVTVPSTFIRDFVVQLKNNRTGQLGGFVQLDGKDIASQSITVQIPELDLRYTTKTDETGRAKFDIPVSGVELWSPENPRLYNVSIATNRDSVQDRIGLRTIETRGTEILLNGEPIFLRGVCLHEESAFVADRVHSREQAATLLNWARELNCNFVRLAHYPHNEHTVRLADEMGLLVWSEIPVYWTINWTNPATLANARNQLKEMITRDRNRACVILWSLANETPVSDARGRFLEELALTARALDPTRLLTAAMEKHYEGDTAVISDPLGQVVDVLGCNEYIGWYDGPPSKADRVEWKVDYVKPLIMSEFGAGALAGHHGDERARWTEEYQADVYRHQVEMLRDIDPLRGTTPWILKDFRSPRRMLPDIQDYWNRKGLLSEQGQKKQAWFIMQDFYRQLRKQSR